MQQELARQFLRDFTRERYLFGVDCLEQLGTMTAPFGKKVALIAGGANSTWGQRIRARAVDALTSAGVALACPLIPGVRPNAPREDVQRLRDGISACAPDAVVVVGAGSTIDAAKAATALAVLGETHQDIEACFGSGQVSAMLQAEGKTMLPLVAVQLAASSAAHLTKYANITDLLTGQKKLIIDTAMVPTRALFDYGVTTSMPRDLTLDGALDGFSHALEVLYGCHCDTLAKVGPIATLAMELLITHVSTACAQPDNRMARESLGLGTDLGGYCIMLGSTNGAHLTSFSLVDILPHGRACALMNPYYTVFFAPAIEPQLRLVGALFAQAGYLRTNTDCLHGRDLGLAVADAMLTLSSSVGYPTTLGQIPGFTDAYIQRALDAARNPQLAAKLQAMPVPLTPDLVDEYMAPVLLAARTGDFSIIRNMPTR